MEKLEKIDKAMTSMCVFFRRIGMVALVGMIGVICLDVFARYVFNDATIWAYDMSWILSLTLAACCLASAHMIDSNIAVDIVSSKFPMKVQLLIRNIVYIFIGIPVFAYLDYTWIQKTIVGIQTLERSSNTSTWYPVLWPERLIGSIGLFLFFVVYLYKIVRDMVSMIIMFKKGKEGKGK